MVIHLLAIALVGMLMIYAMLREKEKPSEVQNILLPILVGVSAILIIALMAAEFSELKKLLLLLH
jgi:hypothetical protein